MKQFTRNIREQHKDQAFKQNILKMVLCRLDFEQLFSFGKYVEDYQKHFSSKFPIAKEENIVGFDIDLTDRNNPILKPSDEKVYNLSTQDAKKKIKLAKTSLILEHHKYSGFTEFSEEFKEVSNYFFKDLQAPFVPKQLSIRKVNSYVLAEGESLQNFSDYFNESLVQHLKIPMLNKSLKRDKHVLNFIIDEKYMTNLSFSTETGNTAKGQARRFILDIDVSTKNVSDKFDDLFTELNTMNNILYDVFWWSIEKNIVNYLKSEKTENE